MKNFVMFLIEEIRRLGDVRHKWYLVEAQHISHRIQSWRFGLFVPKRGTNSAFSKTIPGPAALCEISIRSSSEAKITEMVTDKPCPPRSVAKTNIAGQCVSPVLPVHETRSGHLISNQHPAPARGPPSPKAKAVPGWCVPLYDGDAFQEFRYQNSGPSISAACAVRP